jgi:hypothetical protein
MAVKALARALKEQFMIRTYKAILHGDHVEWIDKRPEQTQPVPVHITPLEDIPPGPGRERGRAMAEALAALASRGTFAAITDPVAWQRELRHERSLPARER